MNTKTLYALLAILIVVYIVINLSASGINILDTNATSVTNTTGGAAAGNANFPKIEGLSESKVNNTDVKYVDNNTGVAIDLQKIDNSNNLSDTYNSLVNQGKFTSSQEVDQNGITTYYLYKESQTGYSADIYFNKNNQNFKISGENITYENSDFFIKNCKQIIDSIGIS